MMGCHYLPRYPSRILAKSAGTTMLPISSALSRKYVRPSVVPSVSRSVSQ